MSDNANVRYDYEVLLEDTNVCVEVDEACSALQLMKYVITIHFPYMVFYFAHRIRIKVVIDCKIET